MDFLIDENFPFISAGILQAAGHRVRTVSTIFRGLPDTKILTEAIDKEEYILTFDKDFGELVFKKKLPCPPAIILFRLSTYKPADPAEIILKLTNEKRYLFAGYLTVIHRNKIRQKKLPGQTLSDIENLGDITT